MTLRHSTDGFADVVIGMQYGDEGKGRFVDQLASNYDWVARYNGGPNAGHSVETNGQKLALNQIPSGVVHPHAKLYIGSQSVVDLVAMCEEIEMLEKAGLQVTNRLRISSQASVIQPVHVMRDYDSMKKTVGTTGKGIGPAYADQAARVDGDRQLDIRMGDLADHPQWALDMIEKNLDAEQDSPYTHLPLLEKLKQCIERLRDCIDQDTELLLKEIRSGMKVLLEGAQSFNLDKNYGITPDVTSSNTGVAAAFTSSGIPVDLKRKAYGVAKLIPSRVGNGPFVGEYGGEESEIYSRNAKGTPETPFKKIEHDQYFHRVDTLLASKNPFDVGIALRILGNEYGVVSWRPRRLGMLDLVQLRRAANINGLDGVFLTKGDLLKDFSRTHSGTIPVTTGYMIDEMPINYVPTTKTRLQSVQPQVRHFDAFTEDVSNVREYRDLPHQLRNIMDAIEEQIGCVIHEIGVGPGRGESVTKTPIEKF